ncbi:PREDICTED: cystathionine gamma-lyase-like [Propithecus coquereli]|uniref:cystathionine gamma-lyase-like n=1 Tax=Propithecus coquereli TaxID=379532 RepID=UPI00063FB5C4|nr:PREDICTED: cystathionine gamma-lyase-like [Propithecus coquereli]
MVSRSSLYCLGDKEIFVVCFEGVILVRMSLWVVQQPPVTIIQLLKAGDQIICMDDVYGALGAVPSPVDCYLCNRGLKTLQVRMEKHFKNGMAVAQFLESNPRVEKVIYPGLPSHPQHELAKRQCTGCTGMVTFYIKGTLQHAETFLKNLKVNFQNSFLNCRGKNSL